MVCKGAYLRSSIQSVEILKYLGITHVTLANNHIFDYGKKGARDTVDVLESAGIKYVGLCNGPEILSKGDSKVMLEGYCCYSANGVKYGKKLGKLSLLDYESVEKFIERAREQGCVPIVSAHYGIERLHYPSVEHLNMFRSLAIKAPFILHGNHPHAIQGGENKNNAILFYALGNLCFDDLDKTSINEVVCQTEESTKGYIVKLDIENNKVIKKEIIGTRITDDRSIVVDQSIVDEYLTYSTIFDNNIEDLKDIRAQEIKNDMGVSKRKGIKFILARLNWRYIVAYLYAKFMQKNTTR